MADSSLPRGQSLASLARSLAHDPCSSKLSAPRSRAQKSHHSLEFPAIPRCFAPLQSLPLPQRGHEQKTVASHLPTTCDKSLLNLAWHCDLHDCPTSSLAQTCSPAYWVTDHWGGSSVQFRSRKPPP